MTKMTPSRAFALKTKVFLRSRHDENSINKQFVCIIYLFLVVEMHLAVRHLPPQPVHLLAELQLVFPLVRGLVQLFGQVEILPVQLGVFLTQLSQLLLQVGDYLRQQVRRWVGMDIFG